MINLYLERDNPIPILCISVGGNNATAMLDTGAQIAILNSSRHLSKFTTNNVRKLEARTKVTTPAGTIINNVVVIDEICIGSITIHNICAVYMDISRFGVDIILPAYLLKFNSFALSYDTGKLVIDDSRKDVYVTTKILDNSYLGYLIFANRAEWVQFNKSDAEHI